MKKFLLLSMGFLLTAVIVHAQVFVHESGKDTAYGYTYNADISIYNKIRNTSNNDVVLKWEVVAHNASNGWVIDGICDNILCRYTSGTGCNNPLTFGCSYLTDVIPSNTVADMHVIFKGAAAPDNSFAYAIISETDTATNFNRTNTFIALKGTAGVKPIIQSSDKVTIFPNPLSGDVLNVIFHPSLNVKTIGVYNLIGKVVAVYKTSDKTSAKLTDLNKLAGGVYFLRLSNADGQVVATKKFTNQ